jgi:hypothetical protein
MPFTAVVALVADKSLAHAKYHVDQENTNLAPIF